MTKRVDLPRAGSSKPTSKGTPRAPSSAASASAPITSATTSTPPSAPPPAPQPAPAGVDARYAVRIPHRAPAQLVLWPAGPRTAPLDVQVMDYSRVGVGLVSGEIMLIGQKYVVHEEEVTRGSSTCLYQVVRCDRRADGRFSVGLRICRNPMDLEPKEEPPRHLSRRMQWAYFLFALLGACAVLAYTLWRHFR